MRRLAGWRPVVGSSSAGAFFPSRLPKRPPLVGRARSTLTNALSRSDLTTPPRYIAVTTSGLEKYPPAAFSPPAGGRLRVPCAGAAAPNRLGE